LEAIAVLFRETLAAGAEVEVSLIVWKKRKTREPILRLRSSVSLNREGGVEIVRLKYSILSPSMSTTVDFDSFRSLCKVPFNETSSRQIKTSPVSETSCIYPTLRVSLYEKRRPPREEEHAKLSRDGNENLKLSDLGFDNRSHLIYRYGRLDRVVV
jgi:hypothetical protein